MSRSEFSLWCRYRAKYGPMNPVRMFDQSGAFVAAQVNNAHGGKATPKDFMPHYKEHEQQEVSIQEFVDKVLKGAVKIGKRR